MKTQKGFSLIELLVVVAIIGVLAAAGIAGYQGYLEGVKTDTAKNQVIQLKRSFETAAIAANNGLTSPCSGLTVAACGTSLAAKLNNPLTGNNNVVSKVDLADVGTACNASAVAFVITAQNAVPADVANVADAKTVTIGHCDGTATAAQDMVTITL